MPATPVASSRAEANLAAALLLLRQLQRLGMRRLVLCPGSRSAPLALAAGLLEAEGLDLITALDERSAAFLALGCGRADGVPAAVVTTSGSAVANLLPAVVEADHGAVPLLLLTADRPQRLKGRGANQTVNQEAFLAPCCRWFGSAATTGIHAMSAHALQQLAQQAWQQALGAPQGAVHLNLPVDEPLHPPAVAIQQALAAPTPDVPPLDAGPLEAPLVDALSGLDPRAPGAVIAGPWRGTAAQLPAFAAALQRWQQRSGWPVLADALSGLRGWPGLELVHGYDLLLSDGHGLPAAPQLLRLGSMPASRRLQQWIASCPGRQLLITEHDPRPQDAGIGVSQQFSCGLAQWLAALPLEDASNEAVAVNRCWAAAFVQRDRLLQQQLNINLAAGCSEPALARQLSRLLPAGVPLMLASSSPVRDWESFAAADGLQRPVFGFRGASGIDGTLSLAAGLAISSGRLVLLCGDLALLHDANGWLWHQQLASRGVRLTVVLIDNAGGGIFEQLPIRADQAFDFDRLFAMPQAVDLSALAGGYGIPARAVAALDRLATALQWAEDQPMALLHLRTDRQADAGLRQALRRTMAELRCDSDAEHPFS